MKFSGIDAQRLEIVIREFNFPRTGIATEQEIGALLLGIKFPFSNCDSTGHGSKYKGGLLTNFLEMACDKMEFFHPASLSLGSFKASQGRCCASCLRRDCRRGLSPQVDRRPEADGCLAVREQ
jgi:hypothetical protein